MKPGQKAYGHLFDFLRNKSMLCVLIRIASLRRFLWVHTTYIFKLKIEISNYPKYINICSSGKQFLGTQRWVRNSRGKHAIGVQANKVSMYLYFSLFLSVNTLICFNIGTPKNHNFSTCPKLKVNGFRCPNIGKTAILFIFTCACLISCVLFTLVYTIFLEIHCYDAFQYWKWNRGCPSLEWPKHMEFLFHPIALRKAKIAYNFGLSECNRVKMGFSLPSFQNHPGNLDPSY